MEHRSLVRSAADNAAVTYTTIASAVPGATIVLEPGLALAKGPVTHTSCNFAMVIDVERMKEGIAFVREDRVRLLYSFVAGSLPAHDPDLLRVHRLTVMAELDDPVAHHLPELGLLPADRSMVARFMAMQFFKNLAREARDQIADATERAEALELIAFQRPHQPRIVGAVMLCRTPEVMGLYNLCVDSNERDRGIGRRIVRHVSQVAAGEGRTVTLQCDPTLAPWYRDQGFRELAELQVWSATA